MTPRPLVSVVIPCFNLGTYLDETVQSVLAQTVDDFEILIVDDGSTDVATRALLATARWPRAQVFHTENRGLARARNFLLEHARGEFLCALDADDKLDARYLESTLAAFEKDPGLTFVSTRLQMFGTESRVTPEHLRCDLPTLLVDCPIFCAALTRRTAVAAVGGYDEQLAGGNEDWDLWISLLEGGHRGVILPEILFYYRRRPGSMCNACMQGERHVSLMTYLIHKHRASYQRHLADVLAFKERQIGRVRQAQAILEEDVFRSIPAAIACRREELARLRQVLERYRERAFPDKTPADASEPTTTDGELMRLRAEYQRCLEEVEALRASASWRVTAPLRRSYELLFRVPAKDTP